MANFLEITEEIQKYKLDSLVEKALSRPKKKKSTYPKTWLLLAYLELVYKYSDNNYLKFTAKQSDFYRICDKIFQLMDSHKLADFNDSNNIQLFFWMIAYQQFPYQERYRLENIDRQYFLFMAEEENSRINALFQQEYGMPIKSFLNILKLTYQRKSHLCSDTERIYATELIKKLTIRHEEIPFEIKKNQR